MGATSSLRRPVLAILLCAASIAAVAPGAGAQSDYVYDDGESNTALGLMEEGDICWLHRFDAVSGADTIVEVNTAFGSANFPGASPPAGTPITVCVWEVPATSGHPTNADLLTAAQGVIVNPDTDIINVFPVDPVLVRGNFFVGCFLTQEASEFPAPLDGHNSLSGSVWVVGNSTPGAFDADDLGANDIGPYDLLEDLGFPMVYLLRSHGLGSPGIPFCFGDGSGAPCPCNNESTPGAGHGCRNSSGQGGLAVASGTDSVSMDDLRIHASYLLPNQPGLLYAGRNSLSGGSGLPFGDGLRCAGGDVVRLGVKTPDANGEAIWGPDLGSQGGWAPGDTRYFQVWFRDPGGPCGSGFNLTNGLEVVFGP